jgi:hypothetical protein
MSSLISSWILYLDYGHLECAASTKTSVSFHQTTQLHTSVSFYQTTQLHMSVSFYQATRLHTSVSFYQTTQLHTSVSFYQTTQLHIPRDHNPDIQCCENPKSHSSYQCILGGTRLLDCWVLPTILVLFWDPSSPITQCNIIPWKLHGTAIKIKLYILMVPIQTITFIKFLKTELNHSEIW